MNRRPSYTRLSAIVMMSGLVACAGVPSQEMSDARQALQAARAAEADMHASQGFREAEQRLSKAERELAGHFYARARKDAVIARSDAIAARNIALALADAKTAVAATEAEGVASPAARDWLTQAEAAAQAVREDEAVRAAERAKEQAQQDLDRVRKARRAEEQENRMWLDKAAALLQETRLAVDRMTPGQRERLIEIDIAVREGQGKRAHDLAVALLAEVRAANTPTASPPPPTTMAYRCVRGDNLWKIAARAETYGNPLWWPLILSANRDRITDPDVIEPGQELVIDLRPEQTAIARAVAHALLRGPWSIKSQEITDRAYLRDAQ